MIFNIMKVPKHPVLLNSVPGVLTEVIAKFSIGKTRKNIGCRKYL
jgi:hypothetical protein